MAQKFLPEERSDRLAELSPRRNIVVIADEAHRSQYGFIAPLITFTAPLITFIPG
jgi:type I site-specific restriction-modification system R (restriction) subunit